MQQVPTDIVALREKYAGKIEPGVRNDYTDDLAQMQSLLNEWNPVGASLADLATIVGEPPVQRAEAYYYIFESGFGGTAWEFTIRGDVITGVERLTMN